MLLTDSRAFPAAPPADIDDPAVITQHDRAAFEAVETMKNHWDRGWAPGRRVLYWMLTFPGHDALLGSARACQVGVENLGLDLVPEDGLHVTMVRIGEVEHVAPSAVEALVGQIRDLPLTSFTVAAHPLAGSMGAVRYSLTPWRPLVALHAALTAGGVAAGVPGGRPTSAFRPHLSLAYNPLVRPAAPVGERVASLRSLPPVALEVTSVELVELRREERAYCWDVRHRVELAPAASPAVGEPGAWGAHG